VGLEPRLAQALVKKTKGSGLARAPFLGARSTTTKYASRTDYGAGKSPDAESYAAKFKIDARRGARASVPIVNKAIHAMAAVGVSNGVSENMMRSTRDTLSLI
jgi:hypothetical protein